MFVKYGASGFRLQRSRMFVEYGASGFRLQRSRTFVEYGASGSRACQMKRVGSYGNKSIHYHYENNAAGCLTYIFIYLFKLLEPYIYF
jgi:hypothetical protein